MNMYKYIHCIPFFYPIDVLKMIGGQISLMFNLLGRMKNPAVDWPVLGMLLSCMELCQLASIFHR